MSRCHTSLSTPLKPVARLKASKPRSYEGGYKYCSKCATYYLTGGARCPCCGGQLRLLPRRRKHIRLKRVIPPPEILIEAGGVRVRPIRMDRTRVEEAGAVDGDSEE